MSDIDWSKAYHYEHKAYVNISILNDPKYRPPDGLQLKGAWNTTVKDEDGNWGYVHCNRNPYYVVDHCYFDNSDVDPEDADEAISVIWGASARIQRTYIKNWGKGILICNGDEPDEIRDETYVEIDHCIIDGCSRRCPYIKGGIVRMTNSLICNWGATFHEKSFGVRVGGDGVLLIENCIFLQDSFMPAGFSRFLKDCIYQVDSIKHLFNVFKPGSTRGLFTDENGHIRFRDRLYKNRWWIHLDGKDEDRAMTEEECATLMEELDTQVPHSAADV